MKEEKHMLSVWRDHQYVYLGSSINYVCSLIVIIQNVVKNIVKLN